MPRPPLRAQRTPRVPLSRPQGQFNWMDAALPRPSIKSQDMRLAFDTRKPFCVPQSGAQNGAWDLSAPCAAHPPRSKLYVWNEIFFICSSQLSPAPRRSSGCAPKHRKPDDRSLCAHYTAARFRLFVGFIQQRAGVGIGEIFQDAVIRRIQMDEQAGLAYRFHGFSGRSTVPPPSDSTIPSRWDSSRM